MRRQLQTLALMAGLITATTVPAANDTLLAEYNYYESGKIELNAGNYKQAITHYTNLRKLYPKSPYIPQAKLETAYAYYKLGDADAAIPFLEDFFAEDNKHTHKPYAFYLAGLCKYQEALRLMESPASREGATHTRSVTQQAIDYFTQLMDKFPASQYSEDARQKTTYLLEKLMLHRINAEEKSAIQSRQQRIKAESENSIAWLMKQHATYYTLQLVRAPDYDSAFNIAVQYKLETKTTIIETQTAEGIGYTLLYGVYPTKREAMQADASLPATIPQSQPGIRELGSLQAEIVESRLLASGIKQSAAGPQTDQPPPITDLSKAIGYAHEERSPHERWLLSQSPSAFTIQLMGASSEENLSAFITDNNLTGQIAYYKSILKDGSSWYLLLYGSYPDQAAAAEAAQEIGARLQIAPPWIRSFGGIQNEIKNTI